MKDAGARDAPASPPAPPPAQTCTKRRTRPRHVLQILEWRLQQVQEQCDGLQARHTALAGSEAALGELCEAMALIQLCQRTPSAPTTGGQQAAGPQAAAAPTHHAGGVDARTCQRLSMLLEREGELLQHLTGGHEGRQQQQQQQEEHPEQPEQQQQQQSPQQAPQLLLRSSMLPRAPDAIAPASDPLHLHRRLAAPALEDVSALTATDVARLHREAARGMGLQLQLLSSGATTREAASRAIDGELIRLLRILTALMVTNRRDVIFEYAATNVDTLRLAEPGSTPANCISLTAKVVPHLGLTPLQEESIALMVPVWRHCQEVLEAEMAQLRHGIATDIASSGSATPAAGAAQQSGGARGDGSSSAAMTAAPASGDAHYGIISAGRTASSSGGAAPLARSEQLEASAACADRLGALLHKIALLNVTSYVWVASQLSWVQLAELFLRCHPYTPLYYHVAVAIRDQWQARRAAEAAEQDAATPPLPQAEAGPRLPL